MTRRHIDCNTCETATMPGLTPKTLFFVFEALLTDHRLRPIVTKSHNSPTTSIFYRVSPLHQTPSIKLSPHGVILRAIIETCAGGRVTTRGQSAVHWNSAKRSWPSAKTTTMY